MRSPLLIRCTRALGTITPMHLLALYLLLIQPENLKARLFKVSHLHRLTLLLVAVSALAALPQPSCAQPKNRSFAIWVAATLLPAITHARNRAIVYHPFGTIA